MSSEKTSAIRIAIIEDNKFIRSGIELILNSEPDFILIGSYQSCEVAFYNEEISESDIVIMDIRLPGMSGIDGISYLKKHSPEILILVYTAFEDDENIIRAISAGAVGFLSKKIPVKELLSTLRNLSTGCSPITPNVARNILSLFQKQAHDQLTKEFGLTETEEKILEKISSGKSYTTVAAELMLTEKEILINVRSIYEKLQHRTVHCES